MNIVITRLIRSALPLAVLLLTACSGGGGGGSGAATTPTTPAAVTYSVSGTLMGLATGNSIVLTNNGTDNLTLSASGVSQTFTFATQLANAATYSVTQAATTPAVQPCTSTYGAGAINAANVTNLNVICGLAGGLSTFTATGLLATARTSHTATLLPSGKVLVVGGYNNTTGTLASAELYDPSTGAWSATGSLATARYSHTATLLPDGKVLVSGGAGATTLSSAELYDPSTGVWTSTGSLTGGRTEHTATLLTNGKVLLSGGSGVTTYLATAELYDPSSGLWTATGSLTTGRLAHTATLLTNGKVLVSGGNTTGGAIIASAELYNPSTGTWTPTGSLTAALFGHTATLLPNGAVIVNGAVILTGGAVQAISALYDPNAGTWTATAGSPAQAREWHTATLLPNGKVLIVGGSDPTVGTNSSLASAELFDPISGTWAATTGSLAAGRNIFTATLLTNGKVLISAGIGAGGLGSLVGAEINTAELYY